MTCCRIRYILDPSQQQISPVQSANLQMLFAGMPALSPAEAERFTMDSSSTGNVLYTTSNNWLEVNYTQLVVNARNVLPLIKPGAIPLAMVKVSALHL